MQEARRREGAASEDRPVLGAMRQDQPLVGSKEDDVMIAGDASAADAREADRAVGVVNVDETSPLPAAVVAEIRKVAGVREVKIVRV